MTDKQEKLKPLEPLEAEAAEAISKRDDLGVLISRDKNTPEVIHLSVAGVDISSIVEPGSVVVHSGNDNRPPTVSLTLVPDALEVWL